MIRTTTLAALPVLGGLVGGALAGCANPSADPQPSRRWRWLRPSGARSLTST